MAKEHYPELAVFSYKRLESRIERRLAKKNKPRPIHINNQQVKESYAEYIKGDEWKTKSTLCKLRALNFCEVCGSQNNLQTHHYNYKFLFSEREQDLFCLCGSCHETYHKEFPANKLPKDKKLSRDVRLSHIKTTILNPK